MKSKIKIKIRDLFSKFGYGIVRKNVSEDMDKEFKEIYDKCKDYTMTSVERMYSLYKSVEYVVNSKIQGDFVECGVWKGGSSMVIAHTLLKMNETNRKIYLYDTFEGMSKPSEKDKRRFDSVSAISSWKKSQKDDYNEWCYSRLNELWRVYLRKYLVKHRSDR